MKQEKAKKRVRYVRFAGISKAAETAGVTCQHLTQVCQGIRPGSIRCWDAIEAAGIRDALTGRLLRRPRSKR